MRTTTSSSETEKFGREFSNQLKGGDIVCLYGELGAGKTTLVKGIADGLVVKDEITSPTFTLMNVYNIKTFPPEADPLLVEKYKNIKTLVHIDTYRLKNEQELIDIGAEDYLGLPNTVCIIEWPEKIEKLLTGFNTIKLTLSHEIGDRRKIDLIDG